MGDGAGDEERDDGAGGEQLSQDPHPADLAMPAEIALQNGYEDGTIDDQGLGRLGHRGVCSWSGGGDRQRDGAQGGAQEEADPYLRRAASPATLGSGPEPHVTPRGEDRGEVVPAHIWRGTTIRGVMCVSPP